MFLFIVGIILCFALGGFVLLKSNTSNKPNNKQTTPALSVEQPTVTKPKKNNTTYTTVARDTANAKKLDELNTYLQGKLNELNNILQHPNVNINIKFEPIDFPDKPERKQHIIDNFGIIKQLISLICKIQSADVTKNYLINKMRMSEIRINQEIKIRNIINTINQNQIIENKLIDDLLKKLNDDDKNKIISSLNDNQNVVVGILKDIIKKDNNNVILKTADILKKILVMSEVDLNNLKKIQSVVINLTESNIHNHVIYDLTTDNMKNINSKLEIINILIELILSHKEKPKLTQEYLITKMQMSQVHIEQEIKIRTIINTIYNGKKQFIEQDKKNINDLIQILNDNEKTQIISLNNNKLLTQIISEDTQNVILENLNILKKILLMDERTLGKLIKIQQMVKKIKEPTQPIEFNSDFIYDLKNEEMDTILNNENNIKKIRGIIKGDFFGINLNVKEILMREGGQKRGTKKRKRQEDNKTEEKTREGLVNQIAKQIHVIHSESIAEVLFNQNKMSKIFDEFGLVGLYLHLVLNKDSILGILRKDGDDVVNIEFVKGNIEKIIEILKTNKHLFLDRDIQLGVEYVNDQIKTKKRNFQLSKSRINTLFENIGIKIEWGSKKGFLDSKEQITKWTRKQKIPQKKHPRQGHRHGEQDKTSTTKNRAKNTTTQQPNMTPPPLLQRKSNNRTSTTTDRTGSHTDPLSDIERKLVLIKTKLREWFNTKKPELSKIITNLNLDSREIDRIYTNIHGNRIGIKYKNLIEMLPGINTDQLKQILLTDKKETKVGGQSIKSDIFPLQRDINIVTFLTEINKNLETKFNITSFFFNELTDTEKNAINSIITIQNYHLPPDEHVKKIVQLYDGTNLEKLLLTPKQHLLKINNTINV